MKKLFYVLIFIIGLSLLLNGCFYSQFKRSRRTVTKDRTQGMPQFTIKTEYGVSLHADNEAKTLQAKDQQGNILWTLSDIKLLPNDIMPLQASPILVLSVTEQTRWGLSGTMSAKLKAYTLFGGELLWETESIGGALSVGGGTFVRCDVDYPILIATGLTQAFSVGVNIPGLSQTGSEKVNITLYGYDVFSGAKIWENEIAKVWNSYNPLTKGMDYFQLFSYPEPRIYKNLYLTFYDGVQAVDIASGQVKWKDEYDIRSGTLERVFEKPKIIDGKLFTFNDERVRAYNLENGQKMFESDELGKICTAWMSDDALFVMYGGYFFDNKDLEWKKETPCALVKLDKHNGKITKQFDPPDKNVVAAVGPTDKGMCMFCACDNKILAVDLNSGQNLWEIKSPLIDPAEELIFTKIGQVAVRSSSQIVWFDVNNGNQLFEAPRGVKIGKPSFSDWALLIGGAIGKGLQQGGQQAYAEARASYEARLKAEKTFLGMSAGSLSASTTKELNKAGVYSGSKAAQIVYNEESMAAVNKARDKAKYENAMNKIKNDLNRADYLASRSDAGYAALQKEVKRLGTRDYLEIIYWDMSDKTKYKALVNVHTGEYQSGAVDGFKPAWDIVR